MKLINLLSKRQMNKRGLEWFWNEKLLVIYVSKERNYMARRTGLEPATPGVTGRYSNQLNYRRT
jgi:hypothetical protein